MNELLNDYTLLSPEEQAEVEALRDEIKEFYENLEWVENYLD